MAVDENKMIMEGSEMEKFEQESANSSRGTEEEAVEEGIRPKTKDDHPTNDNNNEPASPTISVPVVVDTTATTTAVAALNSNDSNVNFLDLEAGRKMEEEEEEEEEKEDGFLILPHRVPRHFPSSSSSAVAEVHNLCAICLESYSPGDSVVWSSNPKCCHVFHTDCMVHYLVRVKNGGTSCPTCRQTFTVLDVLQDDSGMNTAEC
jgi:hypothetical protein